MRETYAVAIAIVDLEGGCKIHLFSTYVIALVFPHQVK